MDPVFCLEGAVGGGFWTAASIMDPSRDAVSQGQGQPVGHQASDGLPWAPQLPYDSSSSVPDFTQPLEYMPLPVSQSLAGGLGSYSYTGYGVIFSEPTSSGVGNALAPLSNSPVSQLSSYLHSRDSSNASYLANVAMSSGSVGGSTGLIQGSALHSPPNLYQGTRPNASNLSQHTPRSHDSHSFTFSALNNTVQLPGGTRRRPYDRPSPSFQHNAGPYIHASRPPSGAQNRHRHDPMRVGSRQMLATSRRQTPGLGKAVGTNAPPSELVEGDPGLASPEGLAQIRELQWQIQNAIIHIEWSIRKPEPPLDVDAMDNKICDICYQQLGVTTPEGVTETPIKLPCGHVFGCNCLRIWLKAKSNWMCPMCRTPITPYYDTVYDFGLWKEYVRFREGLTQEQEIQYLRRVVATKDRWRKEMEGKLVLEATWPGATRLKRLRSRFYDDRDVDEPPQRRFRLSEPDDSSSDDELPSPPTPEHRPPDRAAMLQLQTPPPSDPNNGYEEPAGFDPSDAVTERSLSDVESVETPGPDMSPLLIQTTSAHGDGTWAERIGNEQDETRP